MSRFIVLGSFGQFRAPKTWFRAGHFGHARNPARNLDARNLVHSACTTYNKCPGWEWTSRQSAWLERNNSEIKSRFLLLQVCLIKKFFVTMYFEEHCFWFILSLYMIGRENIDGGRGNKVGQTAESCRRKPLN